VNFRVPPQAIEVEKHVLGAMLLDWGAAGAAVAMLTPDDFYLERHHIIFDAIAALFSKSTPADMFTVREHLTKAGRYSLAGGDDYLMEISAEVVSAANLEDHARIVKEKALYRRQIGVATGILERAYSASLPVQEAQDQAEAEILDIGEGQARAADLRPMRDVLREAARGWEDIVNGKPGGLLSRVQPVDDLLLGFRPGKLYILAARPGLGKSMLALQIAMQCQAPVAHFSMEMLAVEQAERMISQVSDLNSDSLVSRQTIIAKAEALKEAVESIRDLPIWWCDEAMVTTANILSQCRRMKKKIGLGLVIVDYLQLVHSTQKFERRDLEVGAASKFLKAISMKLSVPVLAIASLSRKPEERTDKRPLLSDLRESGNIESDADGVTFLYRESDYNAQAKKDFPDVTEIIQAKLRGGKKGRSIANFDGAHSKFYPLAQADVSAYLNFIGQKPNQPAAEKPRTPRGNFYGTDD
jgi:replicative DNA helicase